MPNSVTFSQALAESLKGLTEDQRDTAAIHLAGEYATAIDVCPDLLNDLGPKLLAVLTALGLTPAGRGAKGGGQSVASGKLDELRKRRQQRDSR